MKKLIYSITVAALILSVSCSEEFLETDNLYEKSLNNFYRTPDDIEEAMSGVYSALYTAGVHSDEAVAANLLSDMMLGGGGPDDRSAKNVDGFKDPEEDTYKDLWVETYNGINRCNAILEKVEEADFSEFFINEDEAETFKQETIGEAYFMRGFFYYRAAKFFGGMPIIPTVDAPRDVPRASYSETFAQIAADFKTAIELLPSTPFPSIPTARYGHANKWVAQAYMARIFLFYTGYMTNIEGQATSDLPLPEGGSINKSQVLAYLNDCINNSGYGLVDDFRNLWPYSYVNTSAGEVVLPWAETEGLMWAGQDGLTPTFGTGNNEFMFVQRYSTTNWDWGQQYNNRAPLFFGIRDNPNLMPFGQGWGWGSVNPTLWNQWDDADLRKQGSILQQGDPEQGTDAWELDKGDHETGLVNKKYITIKHDDPDGQDGVQGMFYFLYDMNNADMQLWAAQDYVYMRFADVLLMHSEISETSDGMNAVRNRAGLGAIGYSLEALKEERMHELAFEGLRWFDLVRWGDVEDAFGNQIDVRNSGVDATYSVQYRSETKGLVPVPESEIRLSNGVYEQNPGW
ncbi:RagB/SusD family nutrient uptake outer membrane protein [Galbibacter sp. EGI 63066]|uniref:RagB/SusD family nutrient uptake outer membrane protein n=1 Tax=Galbibacter sp. EGI 63066 TaxID=2993559 RepID=UPI0022499214|nr:RagB/SusD family nutrient uptake outer membrane protein [Galbibacter sp. EGI 63066]MCX2679276.1 RagB/SusD family nutrient uptake outer membrane protein [Galbibacter sp. EGI 63066]